MAMSVHEEAGYTKIYVRNRCG